MNTARFLFFLVLTLAGCSSVSIRDYAETTPPLVMEEFFDGTVVGDGLVFDRSGKLVREFRVVIKGEWNGVDTLVLHESFKYSDGEESEKQWKIDAKSGADNVINYSGRMQDIVGSARGRSVGKAINWRYDMKVVADGSEWTLGFDDWMWKIDDSLVINRIKMSKFGLNVGEILITFRRDRS
ncbi:MAG: DUF3833 domain-containing protein [Bdellovibrionales bacterium]|nr:DUF3833 domain-containing protein [Bdellovibrionales bacterium]